MKRFILNSLTIFALAAASTILSVGIVWGGWNWYIAPHFQVALITSHVASVFGLALAIFTSPSVIGMDIGKTVASMLDDVFSRTLLLGALYFFGLGV